MRLLLVEDEKKVAEFVARGLRAEHCAVDIAQHGTTGSQMASGMDYDLIVLDLMLPGLNGSELLTRYRRQGGTAPVPVLTVRDSTREKVANFEAGADDYLTKPFAFAELLVRVKALLRRGPANRSQVLRVGDLEIDGLTQQVRRAGKRIELTAKEYALLEYLAANTGRVRRPLPHHRGCGQRRRCAHPRPGVGRQLRRGGSHPQRDAVSRRPLRCPAAGSRTSRASRSGKFARS